MPLVTEAKVHLQYMTNREYGGTEIQQAASMPFLFFLIAFLSGEVSQVNNEVTHHGPHKPVSRLSPLTHAS